jgi:uncharacterized membrane protein YoaK (UPF0700 family)
MHPLVFLRQLSGKNRTLRVNQQLGIVLAFIAGAVNAGGFLAVHQYTSHMSGFLSAVSDNLILGNALLVIAGISSILSFISGAATTAILVNWARHRHLHSTYAIVLLTEAALLLLFGLLGANFNTYIDITVPLTVILLCFIMGLQNAVMTKMSDATIRTTHMTGVVTDLGIELGKMLYWNHRNKRDSENYVHAKHGKMIFYAALLTVFFVGGILGAVGFKYFGYGTVLPLAIILFSITSMPLIDDAVIHLQDSQV